jgi:hypothetical protein
VGPFLTGDSNIPAVFITIDRQDLPKEIIKPHMRSLLWGWDFKKTINIIENSLITRLVKINKIPSTKNQISNKSQ